MATDYISVQTRKRLWLRSGGRCAFPGCGVDLLEANDAGSDTVLGVECHIVARKDAPDRVARSVSSLTPSEMSEFADLVTHRHGFNNLVVMCSNHAKVIDDPDGGYSVSDIVELKRLHEASEDERRRDGVEDGENDARDSRYAEVVDEWAERFEVDDWSMPLRTVFGDGHPYMDEEDYASWRDSLEWMYQLVLPSSLPNLEAALDNFRKVGHDLLLALNHHPHEHLARGGVVAVKRFYNDPTWRASGRTDAQLHKMYDWYVRLLEDLALELTRAVNLVCDAVRDDLDPRYRLTEGLVTHRSGPYDDLMFHDHRPVYGALDGWHPYSTPRDFAEARATRDEHRGSGPPPDCLLLPGDRVIGGP